MCRSRYGDKTSGDVLAAPSILEVLLLVLVLCFSFDPDTLAGLIVNGGNERLTLATDFMSAEERKMPIASTASIMCIPAGLPKSRSDRSALLTQLLLIVAVVLN